MPDINFKAMEEVILVIGSTGGDAGYSVLTPHGVIHVPGNNPEAHAAYEEIAKSYAVLQRVAAKAHAATGLKSHLRVSREG
jgi:hypothetical protein